jgi:molybdopterin molybdotransferase
MDKKGRLNMAHCCGGSKHDSLAKSVTDARDAILAASLPVQGTENVHLGNALGRVLAMDIHAPANVPAWSNSAMDGYALRSMDNDSVRRIIGQSFAGHPFKGRVGADECVRIMTGAVVPEGADAVLVQEEAEVHADQKITPQAVSKAGANIRQPGEDLQAGALALEAGTWLRPAQIGLLASLGIAELAVYRRLRVAFISTGDELRPLGGALAPGQIYDSNRYTLHGMLERLDCEILDLGRIADDPESIEAALHSAATMAALLGRLGTINFWKINMKPGRPLAFGQLGNATFFGLPGNPVSAMVTFYQFARPSILKRMGKAAPWIPPLLQLPLAEDLQKKPGRTDFQRGHLLQTPAGLQVAGIGQQASHIMSGMAHADCLIILAAEAGHTKAGSLVDVQILEGLV